jgi:8-oxo-dGTP diphosphatase
VLYPPDVLFDASKSIRVVAALVERDGRYLITQRRPSAVLPLLWEFPGGRVETGESDSEALRREFSERLGEAVRLEVGELISFVSHPYEHYTVDLYLYQCAFENAAATLVTRAVNAFRWVTSDEFDALPFTPADEASMNQLLGEG